MFGQQGRKRKPARAEPAQHIEAGGTVRRRAGDRQMVGGGDAHRRPAFEYDPGHARGELRQALGEAGDVALMILGPQVAAGVAAIMRGAEQQPVARGDDIAAECRGAADRPGRRSNSPGRARR